MKKTTEHKCLGIQRHTTASEYVTYDGMMAMSHSKKAKERMEREERDYHVFYGKLTSLANRNNTSDDIENRNVKSLERKGIILREGPQVRWRGGVWSTVRYIVLTHEEYADTVNKNQRTRQEAISNGIEHSLPDWTDRECPPLKYDPATGEKIKTGAKPKNTNLARVNLRRSIQAYLGEWNRLHADDNTGSTQVVRDVSGTTPGE